MSALNNFCVKCQGRLPHLIPFKELYYCRYCNCVLKHRYGWNTKETTHVLRCSKIPKRSPCDCDLNDRLLALKLHEIKVSHYENNCNHPCNQECWEPDCNVKNQCDKNHSNCSSKNGV